MKTEVLISGGKEYSIQKVQKLVKDKPVRLVKTSLLPRTKIQHKSRVVEADINVPITLSKEDSKILVVDGQHRIRKARQLGLDELKYRYLTQAELAEAVQPRSTYFCGKCRRWHHKGAKVFRKHLKWERKDKK